MGTLTHNHNNNKRDFDSQFYTHLSKRLKSSSSKPIQAQKSDSSLLGTHRMGNILFGAKAKENRKSDDRKELEANYKRAIEAAKSSCRFFTFDIDDDDDDEVIELVNDDNVVNDDGSGGSEVVMMEGGGRDEGDKSCELQTIRAKYQELDGKAKSSCRFFTFDIEGDDDDEIVELDNEHNVVNDDGSGRVRQEDLLIEPFRELNEDDRELVANALSNASRRKVLVTHENSNITITGEVLQCLRPGAWLNDEVINLYLELLKERERREPKKFLKCHFFNTFFYNKLISGRGGYDYNSVRRWTSQRKLGYSLLECDKIFAPVHKEIHWCFAVINKKEKKFQYLDSHGGVDKQVMGVLEQYIVDEVKDKNGEDIDVTSWKQEFVTDLPNQQNGFDCGVFMIKYADFYSRDIGLCFKQENMPYFRLGTAKDILKLRAD